jgi:hypothetical protein
MGNMKTSTRHRVHWLTFLLLVFPTSGVAYSLYSILAGSPYLEALNWVDATTVLFISLLAYKGIYVFRHAAPLKVAAICLLNAFSFIYCFEGVYKFLFLGWLYSSAELREMLLQGAAALTPLLGFYYGDFKPKRFSLIFAILFAATMAFWALVGYPQLFMGKVYAARIPIDISHQTVYVVNRAAKAFLFLAYFFLYSNESSRRTKSAL